MFRLFVAVALFATVFACEDKTVEYSVPLEGGGQSSVKMDLKVCSENRTIYSHIPETDYFAAVDGIEDYDSGFGAYKAYGKCFIKKTKFSTFQEAVDFLDNMDSSIDITQETNVVTVPLDESDDVSGDILDFCGQEAEDLKLSDETESRALEPFPVTRQTITIQKCFCLSFFTRTCFTTVITVPTDFSLTFVWLFG